ncbi:MAG: dTDP-4-dehydrorhamnose 3,5-epimerase [Planctomycetota bacterium]
MNVQPLAIPDVKLITPKRFGDHRGFFMETYSEPVLAEHGITDRFVQDNHSKSAAVGTLRGLHFQKPPHAQAKLVRVTAGRVLDVAVDIRKGSPTFGQHVTAELSAENDAQLYVPVGFAHGFVTFEPNTEFLYKVSGLYAPQADAGLIWNDPELAIDWPLDVQPVLSEKDSQLPTFADFDSPFVYDT